MSTYRSRPGRFLWKHVGGDIGIEEQHAIGSFDPDDVDRVEPTTIDDLGGTWVTQGGERFEVDDLIAVRPSVVESAHCPPFGEWDLVDEWDVPDAKPWIEE